VVYDCFGDFEGFILDDCGREIRFVVREDEMETLVRFAWRSASRSQSWFASPTGDGRCRSSCAALRCRWAPPEGDRSARARRATRPGCWQDRPRD
jgi:hypothetical protein